METIARIPTTDSNVHMGAESSLTEKSTVSEEILCLLSQHTDTKVLQMLAIHPHIPEDVLKKLAKDPRLWPFLAQNPKAPEKFLEFLAQFHLPRFRDIRMNVAENPNTPVSVLTELGRDADPFVRRCVARNPKTPRSLLEELTKNPDGPTSLNARNTLKEWKFHPAAFSAEFLGREEENHNTRKNNAFYESRQRNVPFEYQEIQRKKAPQTVVLHVNLPVLLSIFAVIIILLCILLLILT